MIQNSDHVPCINKEKEVKNCWVDVILCKPNIVVGFGVFVPVM